MARLDSPLWPIQYEIGTAYDSWFAESVTLLRRRGGCHELTLHCPCAEVPCSAGATPGTPQLWRVLVHVPARGPLPAFEFALDACMPAACAEAQVAADSTSCGGVNLDACERSRKCGSFRTEFNVI